MFLKVFGASLLGAILGSLIGLGALSGLAWHRFGSEVVATTSAITQIVNTQRAASDVQKKIEKHWPF